MTKPLLAFLGAAALSLSAASAQNSAPPAAKAPATSPPSDNFVLGLSAVDKEGEGVTIIVTASQTFNVSRSGLTFNGSLNKTDNGGYRLDYLLETNAARGGTIHTGSSAILHPGEAVQLVRNGEQFYNLRLDYYPLREPAKAEPPPVTAH